MTKIVGQYWGMEEFLAALTLQALPGCSVKALFQIGHNQKNPCSSFFMSTGLSTLAWIISK
jgi:hypothetical protein